MRFGDASSLGHGTGPYAKHQCTCVCEHWFIGRRSLTMRTTVIDKRVFTLGSVMTDLNRGSATTRTASERDVFRISRTFARITGKCKGPDAYAIGFISAL